MPDLNYYFHLFFYGKNSHKKTCLPYIPYVFKNKEVTVLGHSTSETTGKEEESGPN
jgi:hypothetical protein